MMPWQEQPKNIEHNVFNHDLVKLLADAKAIVKEFEINFENKFKLFEHVSTMVNDNDTYVGDNGGSEPDVNIKVNNTVEAGCSELANFEHSINSNNSGKKSPRNLYIPLADVYEDAALINPTPIRWHRMVVYLHGYNEKLKQKVLESVSTGVRLESTLIDDGKHDKIYNHPSAIENSNFVTKKLAQELELNRIAGPFQVKPEGLLLSPLAAIPKREPGEFRLIHDLSYPRESSINSHIPRECSRVSYETLDDCLKIISQLGKSALISKGDIKNAFRILPVSKFDYRLLGFHWAGGFFFDKCLAMGASSSCKSFEELSTSIQWILKDKFNVPFVSHIIDDFIFLSEKDSNVCKNSLQAFIALADSIGLPLNLNKTVQPTTCAELHGILVNTEEMVMSLPPEKVEKGLKLIDTLFSQKKAKIEQIQQIIGFLNFCCKVIPIGRPFLRRLIDLLRGNKPKWFQIRLTKSVKEDLKVWREFLQVYNSKTIISPQIWCAEEHYAIHSDASKYAYAAVYGNKWLIGCFPPKWFNINIAIKEFVPAFLALQLWQNEFENSNVIFYIDNSSVVWNLNDLTSKL